MLAKSVVEGRVSDGEMLDSDDLLLLGFETASGTLRRNSSNTLGSPKDASAIEGSSNWAHTVTGTPSVHTAIHANFICLISTVQSVDDQEMKLDSN